MNQAFLQYFRCPETYADFRFLGGRESREGYFRFGADLVAYGRTNGPCACGPSDSLPDVLPNIRFEHGTCWLPFDADAAVDNLRTERYAAAGGAKGRHRIGGAFVRNAYYLLRPFMPVSLRKHLQRTSLRGWDRIPFPRWPVDRTVDRLLEKLLTLSLRAHGVSSIPFIWFWPDGHSSCAIMTHDVETAAGRDFCARLMDLNESFGIRSSFQIVPEERYEVSPNLLDEIRRRGFEVNIHDLNHDGHLYDNREEFLRRAARINEYAREFGALGFRSAVLYRNVAWYDGLSFSYDMSVPNVGHLDPQRGGCCTIMPYFIGDIVEIPVTATQDYSLFHILNDYSIEKWRQQIEIIMESHGVANFIVHPDYVIEPRAREAYRALLGHLSQKRSEGGMWIPLPRDVDHWWRQRSQMRLVQRGGGWEIEGFGKERARVAFASLENDRLTFSLERRPLEVVSQPRG